MRILSSGYRLFDVSRRDWNAIKRSFSTTMDPIEVSKQRAAHEAVNSQLRDDHKVIGIGSGSTIVYAVERIKELVNERNLKIKCIPTSFQARQLIVDNHLELTSLEEHPVIDLAIDGADEVDQQLTLIKGGGGCLAQEKIVAQAAELFVVIADNRKRVSQLGEFWKYVPIEVLPVGYKPIQERIQRDFGGRVTLRMSGASKAGPVVTDNSNFILDWFFDFSELKNKLNVQNLRDDAVWDEVDGRLLKIAGVVETGLFVRMAKMAFFGMPDGTVHKDVLPN